ncbi:MAG: hypothetical protein RJA79_1114 [Actinomycetota bacterium]
MQRFLSASTVVVAFCLSPILSIVTADAQKPVVEVQQEALKGTVTVSAASSLSDSFTEIAKVFRKINPNIKVRFNFGSTSSLATQIQAGAPSDVIASSDLLNIERLIKSGFVSSVGKPKIFARNQMAIAVKPGNPLKIRSLEDLSRAKYLALCGSAAPCGVYAAQVLAKSNVSINESKITRAVDAKSTLNAVAVGDADAAIVYLTDALAAKKMVTLIKIKSDQNVNTSYAIAAIRLSQNQGATEAFIDFVLSDKGQEILKSFGFAKK